MKPFFQEFCDNVIALDKSVRFAAIADEDGKLMATSERKGLKPADPRGEGAVRDHGRDPPVHPPQVGISPWQDQLCDITLCKAGQGDHPYRGRKQPAVVRAPAFV